MTAIDVEEPASGGSTILLNTSGHSIIEWSEDNDAVMEELIRRKMAEGVTFFRLKRRVIGSGSKAGKKIGDVAEALKARAVAVKDKDFASVIASGHAKVTEREETRIEADGPRITSPAIAARSHTVAIQPRAGG